LLPGLTLGSGASTSNSQCKINGAGSMVTLNGNNLTLTLDMSFFPAFGGNRVIYTAARDINGGFGVEFVPERSGR